jgi:hypothetical protein
MVPDIDKESIRLAMDEAWRDHQHTRDQTWKALQMEFLIAAGIIGANWQAQSILITGVAAIVVLLVTLCGIQITLRHRNIVEIGKFKHITNCEKALGLDRDCLIGNVKLPTPITIWDALNPRKGNTALFILRMHFVILVFSLLILLCRLIGWLL